MQISKSSPIDTPGIANTTVVKTPKAHKKSKKADPEDEEEEEEENLPQRKEGEITKQLVSIELSPKNVIVVFNEEIVLPIKKDEAKNGLVSNDYKIKSQRLPHLDLAKHMKALRKHGLEMAEMYPDPEHLPTYSCVKVEIKGSMEKRNARAVITMAHKTKRSKKNINFSAGEVTLYGDSDYVDSDKVAKIIEQLVDEVWLYLNGKYEDGEQLALFDKR